MGGNVAYPFLPEDRSISYVSEENEYMQAAREVALEESLDDTHPTGSVVVQDADVIGRGANGSNYHDENGCVRADLKEQGLVESGEGYELCEGCHPKNHSEPTALQDVSAEYDTEDADLYLWGHWWVCEPCWDAVEDAGIDDVYLMEDSEELFNKDHENFLFQE